jgi:hypothetical protein
MMSLLFMILALVFSVLLAIWSMIRTNCTKSIIFELSFAVVFLLWYVYGCTIGIEINKDQAVKAGAAYWKCDPKTGDKIFTWIPPHDPVDGDLCGRCSEFVEKKQGE